MVDIKKHELFKEEIYSFEMPNFDFWKKEINQIIKVEDNKIHNYSTDIKNWSNVKAKRTAWDTHYRYQSMHNISQEFTKIAQSFVEAENFDAPEIKVTNLWINWYEKNQLAVPHYHNNHLSLVFFVDVEKTNTHFLVHKEYKNFFLVKKQENNNHNNSIVQINVKDGTCLMFDGGLYHSTTPNLTDHKRITLAVNFEVVYKTKKDL
jgi:uncharacterized protein (TIGR02466 family)